jgi:hypothetical protein
MLVGRPVTFLACIISTSGNASQNGRHGLFCEVLYTDTDHRLEDFFRGYGYRYFRIEKDGLAPRENIVGYSRYL